MARDGSRRTDPNDSNGGLQIPGTPHELFPNPDTVGILPDNDVTDDPEICKEYESIPLSGVSCDGSAPVYFKYFVEEKGCEQCITKVLMPAQVPLMRSCYKMNPCPDPIEPPMEETGDYPPPEVPSDPGSSKHVYIIEDPNNPFPGWQDNKTYTGRLVRKLTFNTFFNYVTTATFARYEPTYSSGTSTDTLFVSWTGKPVLKFELTGEAHDSNDTPCGTAYNGGKSRLLRLNGVSKWSSLTVLQYSYNPFLQAGYIWETGTWRCEIPSEYLSTTFAEFTLIVDSLPPRQDPPDPGTRTNITEDPKPMNCCSCGDIRLMLERQKKDIFKYIDEKAIDYKKIVTIINNLGLNLTQVNFDLSKQIRSFNETNFVGLAANIGILNQTVVDLSNSVLAVNNENTLFISNKLDAIAVHINNNTYELYVAIQNLLFNALTAFKADIAAIVAVSNLQLELSLEKKLVFLTNKIITELTQEIVMSVYGLTLHITNESKNLYVEVTNTIGNSISNSVRYAIKVIIEEIRRNRAINGSNFFELAKNIQQYLALLLFQVSTEIKLAIEGIKLETNIDPDFFSNLVNLLVPVINNSFTTNLAPLTNIVNSFSNNFSNKLDNHFTNVQNQFSTFTTIINNLTNSIGQQKDYTANFNALIELINRLFDHINKAFINLENYLGIKFSDIDFDVDFDFTSIEALINQSIIGLKNDLTGEIKKCCDRLSNQTNQELVNLVNTLNQTINNSVKQIINEIDNSTSSNDINISNISNQLQNLVNQVNQLQNFNNQLLNSFNNFSQNNANSFQQVLNLLDQSIRLIQESSDRNIQVYQQGTTNIINNIATAIDLIRSVLEFFNEDDGIKVDLTDLENNIKLILDKLNEIDKDLETSFPELRGDTQVKCGDTQRQYQYQGKGFIGVSEQLKTVTEVLKLILQSICIDIEGEVKVTCEENVLSERYRGNGIKGLSDQLKAFTTVANKFDEVLCERTDPKLMTVLYPSEHFDHKPIKTQLQIYFGENYPKATGTLIPLYVPNPKANLSWNDFDGLIRDMGQEYVRIQWDDDPLIGSGLWGVNETHLDEMGNKIINLSNSEATLRFTKGGKRKRPIIERQLRAVRAVISYMDDNGKVVETKCFLPPKVPAN